ncbi:MAG TPA: inorganic phosphate transporter [Rubrobacteraceae bacterium]|jgi:PiT family inorganic phosphate transporter|nr:inorganic phosphate transporter [Rubrobacteraceae bacterium]
MPDAQTLLLVLTIAVALFFDFTNGFHDTANAIGTTVGTRALPPRVAVGLSAILNLVGAIVTTQLLHAEVANTVGSLLAPAEGVAMSMLIAVLFGAITWNLITWRAGLPSSSSHALIGALIGMGLAVYGAGAVQWGEVYPVFIALICSPIAGLIAAYVVSVVLLNLLRRARPSQANGAFRRLQLFSSGFVAFSHGANDAQKTMAIITLALFSSGHLAEFAVPTWVALAAALAIGLGTWAGGWRIIRTMGTRIVRMDPVDGFSAQTVAAAVIQLATMWGLPVSTTQVVSGSVMGAGATRRFSAVRWGVARRIVWAWIFTIPASAALAASAALLLRAGPLALALVLLTLGAAALLVRRTRRKGPTTDLGVGAKEAPETAPESVSLGSGSARESAVRMEKSR